MSEKEYRHYCYNDGWNDAIDKCLWAISYIESMSSLNVTPSKMIMPKSFKMKFNKIYKALKDLKK